DPDPHPRGGAHPRAVHRRAAARVVLRHPGPGVDHGRRDPRQRLRHPARHGVRGRAPVHRRADRDRRRLHERGSAGAPFMSRAPPVGTSRGVAALLVQGALAAFRVRRSAFWRERLAEVARRRPWSLAVIAVYVVVAALDAVSWRDAGAGLGAPRSARERLFPADFREASYSAPLAEVEFYGGAPLRHPGRHLLGTDILGRDVLLLTLQGAKVALLVGGFTCAIAIPLALLIGVPAGWFGGRLDDLVFFLISTLASMPSILLLIALV